MIDMASVMRGNSDVDAQLFLRYTATCRPLRKRESGAPTQGRQAPAAQAKATTGRNRARRWLWNGPARGPRSDAGWSIRHGAWYRPIAAPGGDRQGADTQERGVSRRGRLRPLDVR